MKLSIRNALLAGALFLATYPALAEDIDLFLGNPAAESAGLPNVLIMLDNTANWHDAFENEKAALVQTFTNLPPDKFNVGIMTYGVPDVGTVRAAIRFMNDSNKTKYAALIEGMVDENQQQGGDRASARTLSRTMSEAYRYLKGQQSVENRSSLANDHRDYADNPFGDVNNVAVHALPDNALEDEDDITYNSPLDPNSCADTFIIYIGNTGTGGNVSPDNSSRNSAAGSELQAVGGASATVQIPLSHDSHQDNYADEWARFLYKDMGITVYTVDVNPAPRPNGHHRGLGNSDLLESMARVSFGKYFRVTTTGQGPQIGDVLPEIFAEIQAENSVFASVALPASATTQSTFLNQVFIGMFRPDAGRKPRWHGNLKQYRLGLVGSKGSEELRLLDARMGADGKEQHEAISRKTGFITECARSFWTPEAIDNYWAYLAEPPGNCGELQESNSPDGPVVEKGGQAYTLRATNARIVRTCTSVTNCTTLTPFGNAADDNGSDLLNWSVGRDVDNENGDEDLNVTEMRPSVHGDVIHARPVALNYATVNPDTAPEVVVFYGGNDGILRAINGNRSASHHSTYPGAELWSFIPPEFDSTDLARLKGNAPVVKVPATGTSAVGDGSLKSYGMDGAIVAFDGTIGTDSKKFIYATMRRGGRAVYAFDVSAAGNPSLLWRVGCEESLAGLAAGCSGPAWDNIGQTWSAPAVTFREGYDDGEATPNLLPILLMGGGYDTCEDADAGAAAANNSCAGGTKGNSIYVVDGQSGAILREFATERAVPASVTVVPVSKQDPTIKFAYTADTGGNVYRISGPVASGVASPIGTTLPGLWVITRIASLGCATDTTCTANRKFLFAPDVVEPIDAGGALYILLGSGDREKPLLAYGAAASVSNYAFSLVDKPFDGAWLAAERATCGSDIICMNSLTPVTADAGVAVNVTRSPRGWKMAMDASEQVVSSALTISDRVYFSTHIPTVPQVGSCESNLGVATTYGVDYEDGEGNKVDIIGGGLVPSPVAGQVILDDGTIVPFCIGCGGERSAIGGTKITSSAEWIQPKGRVYWRIEK